MLHIDTRILPDEFPDRTSKGRTRHNTEQTARKMKYRPKTWQLQATVDTYWRECGCGAGAHTQPRRPATHQIL